VAAYNISVGCWNRLHSTRTLGWIQKVATEMSWMIGILILLLLIIFIIALALVRIFVSQNQRAVITAHDLKRKVVKHLQGMVAKTNQIF
jgi:hypothetical protein